jgi:hypothetical protein
MNKSPLSALRIIVIGKLRNHNSRNTMMIVDFGSWSPRASSVRTNVTSAPQRDEEIRPGNHAWFYPNRPCAVTWYIALYGLSMQKGPDVDRLISPENCDGSRVQTWARYFTIENISVSGELDKVFGSLATGQWSLWKKCTEINTLYRDFTLDDKSGCHKSSQ